jgi:hypothetical protein
VHVLERRWGKDLGVSGFEGTKVATALHLLDADPHHHPSECGHGGGEWVGQRKEGRGGEWVGEDWDQRRSANPPVHGID